MVQKHRITLATTLVLVFLLVLSLPRHVRAQEQMITLLASPVGYSIPWVNSNTTFAFERAVPDQPTELGSFEQEIALGFPIWQNLDDEVSFSGKFNLTSIDTSAILPDTGEPFPHRLWDISFGPTYRHAFKNRWILGIGALTGSASDEPFSQFDVLDINANVFLKIPSGQRNAWIFAINYASNREFLRHYPLPGFGFLLASKKNVRGFFGIPFFVHVFPQGPISFRASYLPIVEIEATLSAMPSKTTEIFLGYQWRNDRYMRADRVDRNDRLFYYEMLGKAGITLKPARWAHLTFEGGYSFKRKYFEGERFYDDSFNRVEVRPGPYCSMDLNLTLGRPPHSREQQQDTQRGEPPTIPHAP